MAFVEQSVEVDVPRSVAEDAWQRFAQWVLVGNYRLVCDAWSCERMADREVVTISEVDARRSRVTVAFETDDESPDPSAKAGRVNSKLAQDLMRFTEYLHAEGATGRAKSGQTRRNVAYDDHGNRLRVTPDSIIERDDDSFGSPHYQA